MYNNLFYRFTMKTRLILILLSGSTLMMPTNYFWMFLHRLMQVKNLRKQFNSAGTNPNDVQDPFLTFPHQLFRQQVENGPWIWNYLL